MYARHYKYQKDAKMTAKIEYLTDTSLKRLFGANYTNVCVYDYEYQTLRTKAYNNGKVDWDTYARQWSQILKGKFEKEYQNFDLVAQVTMPVSMADYPGILGWAPKSLQIKFDKDGVCICGNLIIRNKHTGTLSLFRADNWFGVNVFNYSDVAAFKGASKLPFLVANHLNYFIWRSKIR